MESKTYIERLKLTVSTCTTAQRIIRALFTSLSVSTGRWHGNGDVEVFNLTAHPRAKRAYGWSYGEPEKFITILELPPVDSPESAVKVGVAYQIKRGKL